MKGYESGTGTYTAPTVHGHLREAIGYKWGGIVCTLNAHRCNPYTTSCAKRHEIGKRISTSCGTQVGLGHGSLLVLGQVQSKNSAYIVFPEQLEPQASARQWLTSG